VISDQHLLKEEALNPNFLVNTMTQTSINLKTAPGHQVLASAGKRALRPGGYTATEQIFTWADFKQGDTVLELASSFGYSAIALAQRYGVRVVGIEKNPESVVRSRLNIQEAGLSEQITIIEGDIFHLENIEEQFDYVLAEAILTMQSETGKAKLLKGICDRLKPNGRFLSHELRANGDNQAQIYQDLRQSIRVSASPLSTDGWLAACQDAGLTIKHYDTGAMTLLDPSTIAREEGFPTLITMGWNMLTRPLLRQRILSMRDTFLRYGDDLGYVVICAEKEAL
jgi:predicted O-methyltransferase YrrM